MTREEAIRQIENRWDIMDYCESDALGEALDMAIEALSAANLKEEFESADAVSREEYEEVKAYMDTLVDAFIEDGEELAESVKVVRCKDCIHSDTTGVYVEDVVHCKWLHTSCVKNGYCHRGERKGGDTE